MTGMVVHLGADQGLGVSVRLPLGVDGRGVAEAGAAAAGCRLGRWSVGVKCGAASPISCHELSFEKVAVVCARLKAMAARDAANSSLRWLL